MRHLIFGMLLMAATVVAAPSGQAVAGQNCEQRGQTVGYMKHAVSAAGQLEKHLNETKSRVAILARVGSDISKHGLRYTHAAFARKREADGKWIVTHLLNKCGTGDSFLINHGLLEFLLDDLLAFDVMVAVPGEGLQEELALSLDQGIAANLYEPNYSMISNPFGSLRYQNSNHWVLDVIAQAQAREDGNNIYTRGQTSRYFRSNNYVPTRIRISPMERLGARIAQPNVHFDDHPSRARHTGRYNVVSVKSIVSYLSRNDDLASKEDLRF